MTFTKNYFLNQMTTYQIIIACFFLGLSIFLIQKLRFFKQTELPRKWLLLLFAIKLSAAFAVLALYTWHYPSETADIHKYFNDSKGIYENSNSTKTYLGILTGTNTTSPQAIDCLKHTDYWYRKYLKGVWNDNRFIIRIHMILYPITSGSILAHLIFFAFVSFIGLTFLLKGINRFVRPSKLLSIAIYCIPNLLLWSSGMLKESIMIFSFGLCFYCASKLYDTFKIKYILLLIVGIGLFVLTKIYILACLFPALVFLLFAKRTKHTLLHFGFTHIIIVAVVSIAALVSPKTNFYRILDIKQQQGINMVESLPDVGSKIFIPNIEANAFSIVKNAPIGLFNSFLQPLPNTWKSPLFLFAGLENIGLLLCLIIAIIKAKTLSFDQRNFLLFAISFVIILYSILGISTPVAGALIRYKIAALPIIGAIIIMLFQSNKQKI